MRKKNEWVKEYRKKKRREEFNGLTKCEYEKAKKIKEIKKLLNKGLKQIDKKQSPQTHVFRHGKGGFYLFK